MTKISTQSYKGVRDFYPADKQIQNYLFAAWQSVAERYGYEEYDASILEPLELFRLKNQTNQEIVDDQMYSFSDRGERQVALRPEMTPTVSRMVAARRQELVYPLRWWSKPNLFRYERPQKGRLREHWQLNVDIFGVENVAAEQELILVVRDILRTLGANDSMFRFRLNNRKLMDSALKGFLGFEDNQLPKISRLIDAKAKLTEEDFLSGIRDCLDDQQLSQGLDRRLWDLLSIQELAGLPEELKQSDGYQELAELLDLLELAGVTNALFDVCIMRGFDYYTGNVFEAFDNNPDNPRSMFGGGRYDGLVGAFGVEPLPTVGFGMGDVTLREFLSGNNLLPAFQPVTQVYVALVGDTYRHALPIAQKLREQAVNVAIDFSGRKLAKQLEAASKKGINWVLFIGDAELESGQLKLKNMQTGEEICNDVDHLIDSIKNR